MILEATLRPVQDSRASQSCLGLLLSGRLSGGSYVKDIMRDGDFASATIVDQVYSGCIWFKALWTGTHKLEVEACCQTDPRVCDVVAIPNIHDLQKKIPNWWLKI